MNDKLISILLLGCYLLTGCNFSVSTLPTPTQPAPTALTFIATETPSPVPVMMPTTDTSAIVSTSTALPVAKDICTDPQVITLIDSLKNAMLNSDGALLKSLVSPDGMEVRWVRYGSPITYSPDQAQFLFETSYEANWGAAPGSGEEKKGSFHDVIVPDLVKIFNTPYTLHCNEIKHGGASYDLRWPYSKDFYSVYDAGTEQNGNLDWHTWLVGIEYSNGKPYIYALMQFYWEP
jgi:hypothetical protein